MKLNLAIFISGNGSDLQAIIDAIAVGKLDAKIALIVSNNPDAFGLVRAKNSGIPTLTIQSEKFSSREEFINSLIESLDLNSVDFIALAGYLKKIPPEIIRKFKGRIINIHPGPLPEFGGKGMFGIKVHEAVILAGLKETRVTIHQVTEDYDEGAIVATRAVPVFPDDTPESLQKRTLEVEHSLYPEVLQKIAKGEIIL
jgi:phosphoribosylglycinamide formyltransferase-1